LRAGASAIAGIAAAGSLYDEAIAAWRALRLPLQLALCLAERDRFLVDEDQQHRSGTPESEAILEGLGAAGLLRAIHPVAPR
jgi:hypothetical protein